MTVPKRAYVHHCDSFVGQAVCEVLSAKGWTVCGTASGGVGEGVPACVVDAFDGGCVAAAQEALRQADAVVFNLPGSEEAARQALVQLRKAQPREGGETVFLGISSPLTWANTPLPDPLPVPPATTASEDGPAAAEDTEPGSESVPAGVAGSADVGGLQGASAPSAASSREQSAASQRSGAGAAASAGGHAAPESGSDSPEGSSEQQAAPEAGDRAAELLTEEMAERRQGAAAAARLTALENLILRSHRPGHLAAYVVCPGVLYGRGEVAGGFRAWFEAAWAGDAGEQLRPLGDGQNVLPTIHVDDLAAYAAAALEARPPQRYLLAVDDSRAKQAQLLQLVIQHLGQGEEAAVVPAEQLFMVEGQDALLLNLPLARTHLPGLQLAYVQGLPACMPQVAQQFIDARNLNPLRILVTGPPLAGKSTLARCISQLYSLPLLDEQSVLQYQPADGGAGGDALQLMQQALQHHRVRKRGFVLDGWPLSLRLAKLLFTAEKPAGSLPTPPTSASAGKRAPAPSKGKGKGSGKGGAAALPADEDLPDDAPARRPEGHLAPQVVLQLVAPVPVLQRRLQAALAAESGLAEAAGGKGGGKGGVSPMEADFQQRLALHEARRQRDEEDAQQRAAAALEQQAALESAGRADSEALAPKWVKRRRAPLAGADPLAQAEKQRLARAAAEAEAAAAAAATAGEAEGGRSASLDTAGSGSGGKDAASAEETAALEVDAVESAAPVADAGLGGFDALMSWLGARIIKVANFCPETEADEQPQEQRPAEEATAAQQEAPALARWREQKKRLGELRAAQAAVEAELGAPHNLEGRQEVEEEEVEEYVDPQLVAQQARQAAEAAVEAEQERIRAVCEESERRFEVQRSARLQQQLEPLKRQLLASVGSQLSRLLLEIASDQMPRPVKHLAEGLLKAADEAESAYFDPYDAEIYAIQEAKLKAKAEREAARTEAAEAKSLREVQLMHEQLERLSQSKTLGRVPISNSSSAIPSRPQSPTQRGVV